MLTIKSDDMLGRTQAYSSIIQGRTIPPSTVPETFKLLVRKLNGLGLGLEIYSSEDTAEEVKTPQEEDTSVVPGETVYEKGDLVESDEGSSDSKKE
jgi:DNA-directed RNA polymerase subunit beta